MSTVFKEKILSDTCPKKMHVFFMSSRDSMLWEATFKKPKSLILVYSLVFHLYYFMRTANFEMILY